MRRKGEGSILERKRKDGSAYWLIKYDAPRDDGGKRKIAYKTFATLKEARKELRDALSAVESNTHVDPSKITLRDHIAHYVNGLAAQPFANKTKTRYRELLEQYAAPRMGAVRLQSLTTARIKEWHAELASEGRDKPKMLPDGRELRGLSATTVRNAHRALNLCLQAAVEARLIAENPARGMRLRFDKNAPTAKPRTAKDQALGKDRLKALLAGLKGGDLYLLATLLASTGLRRGEALGLAWRHIDLEGGTLTVERSVEQTKAGPAFKAPKNDHSARLIALPEDVTALLRAEWKRQAEALLKAGRRVSGDDLMFQPDPFAPARPYGPDWISLKFSRAAKKLGFDVGLHSLRHSHASQLLAAGVPATAVAARLGHSSVRTTLSVYAHVVEEAERRAADTAAAIMRDVLGGEG